MTQSITPEVIAEIRDRIEETELLLAAGASLRAVHAEALYRSCQTLLLALTEAQERAEWQPMETAPRDGQYILAIGAPNDAYHIGRHAGRPFCIRYEFDLGWGVYPGYGGAPDSAFTYWKPLDLPAAQTLKDRNDG